MAYVNNSGFVLMVNTNKPSPVTYITDQDNICVTYVSNQGGVVTYTTNLGYFLLTYAINKGCCPMISILWQRWFLMTYVTNVADIFFIKRWSFHHIRSFINTGLFNFSVEPVLLWLGWLSNIRSAWFCWRTVLQSGLEWVLVILRVSNVP